MRRLRGVERTAPGEGPRSAPPAVPCRAPSRRAEADLDPAGSALPALLAEGPGGGAGRRGAREGPLPSKLLGQSVGRKKAEGQRESLGSLPHLRPGFRTPLPGRRPLAPPAAEGARGLRCPGRLRDGPAFRGSPSALSSRANQRVAREPPRATPRGNVAVGAAGRASASMLGINQSSNSDARHAKPLLAEAADNPPASPPPHPG